MFKYKIDLYAVDQKGKIIMEPRRQECIAFTKNAAIHKCMEDISKAKNISVNTLRILNVKKSLF